MFKYRNSLYATLALILSSCTGESSLFWQLNRNLPYTIDPSNAKITYYYTGTPLEENVQVEVTPLHMAGVINCQPKIENFFDGLNYGDEIVYDFKEDLPDVVVGGFTTGYYKILEDGIAVEAGNTAVPLCIRDY